MSWVVFVCFRPFRIPIVRAVSLRFVLRSLSAFGPGRWLPSAGGSDGYSEGYSAGTRRGTRPGQFRWNDWHWPGGAQLRAEQLPVAVVGRASQRAIRPVVRCALSSALISTRSSALHHRTAPVVTVTGGHGAAETHKRTRTHTRTHTHARARARTHTHTHTHRQTNTHTHTRRPVRAIPAQKLNR